ncbi:MAG: hypothetical protein WC373_04155 [Smithella sp.]|jgi:GT2 family glycosyltransferase
MSEQIEHKAPRKINKANGFCLAIKVSLLARHLINGVPFNEKFPLYGGEDEFFRRVRPMTILVPGRFVFHYKHVSVDSNYFPEQKFRREPECAVTQGILSLRQSLPVKQKPASDT